MDNNHNSTYLNQNDKHVDLKNEIGRYLRFWPWFLLSLAIALSMAYFNLRYTPRIYTTSSKIKILDKADGIELPTSAFIFNRSNINLENEIEILTSYRIIEEVVDSLNLNTSFYEDGQILTSKLAKLPFQFKQLIKSGSIQNRNEFKIIVTAKNFEILNTKTQEVLVFPGHNSYNKAHQLPFEILLSNDKDLNNLIDKTYIVKFEPLKQTVLSVKSKVQVATITQSDLLKLTISSQNKDWSELVLNGLIDVFNKDGINDRKLIFQRTLDFIEDRFVYLEVELDSIEVSKKEFKQDNNLIDLPSDAQIGLEKESESELEVFEAESQIALTNLIIDALKNNNEAQGLLPANIGLNNAGVMELINQYNNTILERDKYHVSGGANNPMVKQLDITILDLKKNIDNSLQAYSSELKLILNQLETRNKEFRGEVKKLPLKEKLLRAIERQQKIKESLFVYLLQKREEAAINLAITEPSVKIVEYALSASGPISPNSRTVYITALLGGLLVPFGILYLIFMLDTKVHSKNDIERLVSHIPVIGEIPTVKNKSELIFENPNDRSILAESFRILSSNVDFVLPNSADGKVIFCSSTVKGEGKTYISINLSLALSSINKKVLLIGADLRNPQIHTFTSRDKNSTGLSSYLHDTNLKWQDLLINGFKDHATHDVLLSGAIPPNPASLLTNGRFKLLIEEAKKHYDYIVVDTAPTILVTDTMLISHLADVNVYLVKAGFTDKKLLGFSKELNASKKLSNMAYVLNNVGSSKSYGYGYNYGYGYGYGHNDKS